MSAMVVAVDVNKYFGPFHALQNVSLEISHGEVLCIIGPSGSGKSTLLRCVNQLERIDSGAIWVDDELVGFRQEGSKLYELTDAEISRQRLPGHTSCFEGEIVELEAIEQAIRNTFAKADVSNPAVRQKIYESAWTAHERSLIANGALDEAEREERREHLKATIT
eukprot:gene27705-33489_t